VSSDSAKSPGQVALKAEERAEIERLSASGTAAAERLGLASGAPREEVQAAAIAGIERWRSRAGNPMSDRQTIEAAEIVSRAYEEIHAQAV